MILVTKLKVPAAKFKGNEATRHKGNEESGLGFPVLQYREVCN